MLRADASEEPTAYAVNLQIGSEAFICTVEEMHAANEAIDDRGDGHRRPRV